MLVILWVDPEQSSFFPHCHVASEKGGVIRAALPVAPHTCSQSP